MGEHLVEEETDRKGMQDFVRHLLEDVEALERMLNAGLFDEEHRIGSELEMFLVDGGMRPAPLASEVLAAVGDPRLTTELARFNLEANGSPLLFRDTCLREMQSELEALVGKAQRVARDLGADILLTGILPTLQRKDLGMDSMTDQPRYKRLNDAILALCGGQFRVSINGIDELELIHDNVMMESANTSFQLHFQVAPREFARLYNIAQVVTAPVLAAGVNSPLFLGRRLWSETRVALFQRSVDDRREVQHERSLPPRVSFGDGWIKDSVLEVFREQIARFRVVLASQIDVSSLDVLEQGGIPDLTALQIHNGTIYRWNRACYGVNDGVPHLRIENRALPAGPTIPDQVANAALFFGLLSSFLSDGTDVTDGMSFADAKRNFFAAARHGLKAQFRWLDGSTLTAAELISSRLLPRAREGLLRSGIDESDIEFYLGIIEARVGKGQTGAAWMLDSLEGMQGGTVDVRERALVSAMLEHQREGRPVHQWAPAALSDRAAWKESYRCVEQFMSRKLFTVRPDDLIDLAACLMDWEHIRHVPVEDESGQLVGLVTHRALLRLLTRGKRALEKDVRVEEIMRMDPLTVSPQAQTLDAMRLMRANHVSCLPVVEDGRLVGIITERDLIEASVHLLEQFLEDDK